MNHQFQFQAIRNNVELISNEDDFDSSDNYIESSSEDERLSQTSFLNNTYIIKPVINLLFIIYLNLIFGIKTFF